MKDRKQRSASESVKKMMEDLPNLIEQGMSFAEVAKKYNIDVSTIYKRLNEIAELHGMQRSALLQRPVLSHSRNVKANTNNSYKKYGKDEIEETMHLYNEMLEIVRELRENVNEAISVMKMEGMEDEEHTNI